MNEKRRKKLLIFCGGLMLVGMFLLNELLYQIMVFFDNETVTVFINFIRYIGYVAALPILFNYTGDFAFWFDWYILKNRDVD